MKISMSETRTGIFVINLVFRDENGNIFYKSRVSRREREIKNYFSRSSGKRLSWFSREFPSLSVWGQIKVDPFCSDHIIRLWSSSLNMIYLDQKWSKLIKRFLETWLKLFDLRPRSRSNLFADRSWTYHWLGIIFTKRGHLDQNLLNQIKVFKSDQQLDMFFVVDII